MAGNKSQCELGLQENNAYPCRVFITYHRRLWRVTLPLNVLIIVIGDYRRGQNVCHCWIRSLWKIIVIQFWSVSNPKTLHSEFCNTTDLAEERKWPESCIYFDSVWVWRHLSLSGADWSKMSVGQFCVQCHIERPSISSQRAYWSVDRSIDRKQPLVTWVSVHSHPKCERYNSLSSFKCRNMHVLWNFTLLICLTGILVYCVYKSIYTYVRKVYCMG
jgi:hypothetical protein